MTVFRLNELTTRQVDALDRDATVLLVPLGSVEQHGWHMPLGTDTILADAVSVASCERACAGAFVLPAPWFGYSPHHMGFAGTVTLRAETFMSLVTDVVDSLVAHGFRRIVLVNGHGGNAALVGVLSSTLGHAHRGRARIAGLTYFQLAANEIARLRKSAPGGMGHAGEFETAMMQHLRPELVGDEAETVYPETGSRHLSTDLLAGNRVSTYLDIADLSASGTLGDPSLADPQAGAAYFAACADALAGFIDEFITWPVNGEQLE